MNDLDGIGEHARRMVAEAKTKRVRRFTDAQLLDMTVKCLEHALQSLAIRDCQCASCKGFMQETPELLKIIKEETGA